MRSRRSLVVSFLLGLTLIAGWSPAGQNNQNFGGSTDVVLIEIPVHVSVKGRPVRGLTAANFEVLEGKKKQKIVGFDVFDLALLDPNEMSDSLGLTAASRRNFLFLFDLSNTLPAGVVRAREAAIEMVAGSLHPADLAGVATYSKSQGLNMVLGFSPDRGQVIAALEGLGVVNPFERIGDPLNLTIRALESTITALQGEGATDEGGGLGARPDANALLLEQLKDMQPMVNRGGRDVVKSQITDLSLSLDELARILDSVTGRKQIVLFTNGFDSDIVFGTTDQARIQEITAAVQFGQTWRVDSEERFGAGDAQITLLSMLENFRRSDSAVHTVDTGGLRAAGATGVANAGANLGRGHDGLFMIANETGGQFYRNANDLGEAMDDLLDRTSVTYVLTIQPKADHMDGEYHELKVRLKNGPKGASISHRPGYLASSTYSDLGDAERQISTAEMLVSGTDGGRIGTNVLAAAFGTLDERAYVMTAIEIDGGSLMSGQGSNVVPAEIYTYAFDSEGRVHDFFTQAIDLDLYKVGYRMQSGFKLMSYLRLVPGEYRLRTLIRNAETGATGLATTLIEVPDFHDGSPNLRPPFFIEAADRWLVGEGKRQTEDNLAYPLEAGGDRLIPASKPVLPVGQEIPVLLVGHRLPETLEAHASFRPLGAQGSTHEAEVTLGSRRKDLTGVERIMARLRSSKMPAGDYELLMTLSSGGGEEITSTIPVTIIESW
jgi:VWFA-related protein